MTIGHRFQKGNTAGKGHGRPKGSGRVQIAKDWVDRFGWKKLIQMAQGGTYQTGTREVVNPGTGKTKKIKLFQVYSEATQQKALEILAHYGHGKPVTAIELSGGEGGDINFNVTVKKFG